MTRRRKFPRCTYLGILRRQKLHCACGCNVKLTRREGYQFDHITALALGGADTPENLRAVRVRCHKKISAVDIRMVRKADRQRKYHLGVKKRRFSKLASRGFEKRLRKYMDGTVEVRT
jgi:5-methylcytosine-specific restriction endonuclease McrA